MQTLQRENQLLVEKNRALNDEIYKLQNDKRTLGELARERMDMIENREVIIKFEK